MAMNDTLKVEGNHRRADGETYPVEVWVNKIAVDGNARYIAVARDITERKQRETELKRSREFIEQAQESASIGGWEVDLTTDSLRWTDEVYRIHDLPTDTDIDLSDGIEFYHPDDRPQIEAAFDRLISDGESYDLELRLITAADRTRWVRAVGDPQFDEAGNITGALGIFQDITDRKERDEELREVKERLDLAVEGANLGVWDWDMETDAVTFNEQWASILGFSLDELEPRLETWENRVHPADMPDVEAALNAHIDGDADLYDCEHRMQTKAGDYRWIRDVGKVVDRDDDGTPTRAVGIHLDITEEKESKLQLEEERDMFAEGPAVVFKWENADGWPVEYVSKNVAETFGYTPEQFRSGEIPYADLIHDDDLDRVMDEVAEAKDNAVDRFRHDPYRMVTADGEIRWVTDNTKIIRTDGEITHYLGYLIDVTEQKRLERSLRESEQSVRELTTIAADTDREFDEKLDALLTLGTERLGLPFGFLNRIDDGTQHVVQAVGDHPELQTGASAPKSDTYCRKTITQSEPLDVQDAVAEGWGNDPAYERYALGCYIGGTVTVDGDQYGTLCFADQQRRDHEFTDAERAFVELLVQWISHELATQTVERKLRDINDTAKQLMTVPDRSQIASIAVESATELLHTPLTGIWWYDDDREALVPAGMAESATEYIDEQPVFEDDTALAWRVFESGEFQAYDDLSAVDALHNNETMLESEAIVPLGDHGVISAGAVKPQAFSEADLNLFEVLSSTVEAALTRAERETVLRETQAELKRSNEELEQFAYAASHDLQEPLRTVSSYLTLLERRYGEELDGDASEFIEFAVDGADRMRKMIQALLAYSRVDTRRESFEPVEVKPLLEQVTDDLSVKIDEADATVSLPATAATVTGDHSQLAQLFQNLIDNGIKYNTDRPAIDISARHDGEMVVIDITDNGIGMEADQLDDIFEVFQRLHTREEFDGTGIGLSICRKIVDRHDGTIDVQSTPGEGSTFTISLPHGETNR
ncbi:PAS domain-containing protein [Halonotius sp. GCM10025705]|uniref:PAS domain-containing protein n=1 Tax=Halonotius sp. GCM10025705 TaxID=3252678 RepID=UPI00360FA5A9